MLPAEKLNQQGTKKVLVGLIGAGIQLSRTPKMHEEEGKALGLDYEYRLLDIELMDKTPPLANMITDAENSGFSGLNITYPYKKEVMTHLDSLSDAAMSVDAVNTVVFKGNKRIGHNTDMLGFETSFKLNMGHVKIHRVLQIGAGGAGGAVAHALLECGVEHLIINDIDSDSAHALAKRLASHFGSNRVSVISNSANLPSDLNGVVNTTPIGMAKSPGTAFPVNLLSSALWVADIIYFPLETELLRAAKTAGCRVLPGSDMALYQAVHAFKLFTGLEPDPARMKVTFDSF